MEEPNNFKTISIEEDSDFINELSEYLDVLSNDVRLKMLKLIRKGPIDNRAISELLKKEYGISSSYQNTKNHLDKLLGIGVIKMEPGVIERSLKGPKAVMNYIFIPGGLEAILRSLGVFSSFKLELSDKIEQISRKISEELIGKVPMIRVLGGADDGKVFVVESTSPKIGRVDPEKKDRFDPMADIVLSGNYRAVTRVSNPHARLTLDGNDWYIEDCESKGGTYVNDERLDSYKKTKLNDGDMIGLAKGSLGVCLLFSLPPE